MWDETWTPTTGWPHPSPTRRAGIYLPAADLVEHIVAEKKPGSIIPLQVGVGEGRRDDYLFQKLDLADQ